MKTLISIDLNYVGGCYMEVLKSITSYLESMNGNSYLYENQKDALGMLYNYCNNEEPELKIYQLDVSFFQEFLMYWLPKNQRRLKDREVDRILRGVAGYCTYIQDMYNIPSLKKYELVKEYKRECLRIYQLKDAFSKYLGDPILSVEPFIVDFKVYKDYKIRKSSKDKQGIYQQGLFQVMEIEYDNTIVLQKLPRRNCIRTILPSTLVIRIRKGDILHLRIKQKQYYSFWEVVDFKNCYLPDASQYLTN